MDKMKNSLIDKSFICPAIFSKSENLVAAQSTRHGGFSSTPFQSLNLGLHTNDDLDTVKKNRTTFFNNIVPNHFPDAPNRAVGAYQSHGSNIHLATKPEYLENYDAFITNQPNLILTVTTADCTPVLIFDPEKKAIAAIHAGWRGTCQQIVSKTLSEMNKQFDTQTKDCLAYIGPCIDECSFEVDADVADHFDGSFKQWDEEKNKFFVDLKKANQAQLIQAGLPTHQIEISPYSTVLDNEHFFSYRKEKGQTGRLLSAIALL